MANITMVRTNVIFSQPLFSTLVSLMKLDLLSGELLA